MKKVLLSIVLWTWCLPQTLIAYILKLFVKKYTTIEYKGCKVYYTNLKIGSVSLSNKIFLCKVHYNDEETIKHEYGHYKQNLYLGWLWLLVIGLPSLCWAGFGRDLLNKITKKNHSYYWFFTESSANKLGGVN